MKKENHSNPTYHDRGYIKERDTYGATKGHSKPGSSHTVAGPPPATEVQKPKTNS